MEKLFARAFCFLFLLCLVPAPLLSMNQEKSCTEKALAMLFLGDKITERVYEKAYSQLDARDVRVVSVSKQVVADGEKLLVAAQEILAGKKVKINCNTFECGIDELAKHFCAVSEKTLSPKNNVLSLIRAGNTYRLYVVYKILDALCVDDIFDIITKPEHEKLYGRLVQHPDVVRELIAPDGSSDWQLCVDFLRLRDEVKGLFARKEAEKKYTPTENQKRLAKAAQEVVAMLEKRLQGKPETYVPEFVHASTPYIGRLSGSRQFTKEVRTAQCLSLMLKYNALFVHKVTGNDKTKKNNPNKLTVDGTRPHSLSCSERPPTPPIKIPPRPVAESFPETPLHLQHFNTKESPRNSELEQGSTNSSHSRSTSNGSGLNDNSPEKEQVLFELEGVALKGTDGEQKQKK